VKKKKIRWDCGCPTLAVKNEAMNLHSLSVTGPSTHESLSKFHLRGSDSFDGSRFIPLDEALEQKCVVHETGNVGHLEIENLSEALDLYVQAGDVVKGGRQDRTLGVDFVLPAKSGRVGGENDSPTTRTPASIGPSPRGWGERAYARGRKGLSRTIPTRVGRTSPSAR
jgi:hypothetical protein